MSRNRKNREFCLCGRGLIHQSRPVCAKNCPIVFIFLNGHNPSTNTAGSCNLCNIWATVPHQPAVRKSDQTRWAFGSMREPVRPTGSDTQTLIHSRSDAKHSNSDTRTSCHSSHVGQRTRKWAGDKNVIRVFFFKRVNGSTRRVCQSEDVTCAPRHVPDSFLSSTHIVLSSERRHCWRFQTTF